MTARGPQADGKHRGTPAWGVVGLLLVLPAAAAVRWLPREGWVMAGVGWFSLSLFTFLAYRSDKRRAERGEWRIPESTLHLAALLGGWPGALVAQRVFRHKTAKWSFQGVFWAMVLLHQYVAADSLFGWRITRGIFSFVRGWLA
ncbi:MAG: DUF1294 domain-containing protein [Verrucomicrobia bacterium]|nr:DUF1294 domain-containing protein [Verrucomicrobiota bacterium]